MYYRHEWKHEINYADTLMLRQRLRAVMRPDPNARGGSYFIRSLYFDNLRDKALREKIDGVDIREKFRIRYYDFDHSLIHLEKKSKRHGLGHKDSVSLTREEVEKIISGDIDWMADCDRDLVRELHRKMLTEGLRPKTIVDYRREPFVFPAGNVRVTLDYDIRTCPDIRAFFDKSHITVPTGGDIILEVKWDEFLPTVIRDAVQLGSRRTSAYSKYAVCRKFG